MMHGVQTHAIRLFAASGFALFALAAFACPSRAADRAIVPFTYWEGSVDIRTRPTWGWPVPDAVTWRECVPTSGALHPQIRYIDTDRNGFVSRGDEIEAVGQGPGVWTVEWVTTYLAFDNNSSEPGTDRLEVASDDFFYGCQCDPTSDTGGYCLGKLKWWPVLGDSFFVLTPYFGQIVTVYDWMPTYLVCAQMLLGDTGVLRVPWLSFPPPQWYRLTKASCGVWLSWDPTTDVRRSTWGKLKSHYRD